jgi:maltose alpha-D-glucosyltransferase/alpha-amylase
MRNMIRLRRQFRVFGRGAMDLLPCASPPILAWLRRWEDDVVLCVANLSRTPQPAELDLSAFEGWVPWELLGFTPFPAIRREPYFLSLGAYGYYWFELRRP